MGRRWARRTVLPDRQRVSGSSKARLMGHDELTFGGGSFNPRLYRMLFDIFRFNLFALDFLEEQKRSGTDMSIGQYLTREGYSDAFKEDYLLVSPTEQCYVWR